jgi:hypothetical protein
MRWRVKATACNAEGPFDAAYEMGRGVGDEGGMVGTPEEVGRELARFLAVLTPEDVNTMKYQTGRFYLELILEPADAGEEG